MVNWNINRSGTPFKEMTTIIPCTDCLVSLVDKPPFVASVRDIEHVHFERVIFSGKNFDMVIIFKKGCAAAMTTVNT
jgi:nucleosome binding factor SPN SPT16 subunit